MSDELAAQRITLRRNTGRLPGALGFGGRAWKKRWVKVLAILAALPFIGDEGGGTDASSGAEAEVVVVAAGDLGDVVADVVSGGEVEGGVGDGADLAGGDESFVDGGVGVGVEGEEVVEDGAVAGAGEVEVGVVGKVDGGGLVGGSAVVDAEAAVLEEGVGDGALEVPGKPWSPSGEVRDISRTSPSVEAEWLGGPEVLVEADGAAVEGIGAVVSGEGVGVAVEGEGGTADAVGDAADGGAEVGVGSEVGFEGGEGEVDVGAVAFAVGGVDLEDVPAEVGELEGDADGVEGEGGDGAAVGGLAVGRLVEAHRGIIGMTNDETRKTNQ